LADSQPNLTGLSGVCRKGICGLATIQALAESATVSCENETLKTGSSRLTQQLVVARDDKCSYYHYI